MDESLDTLAAALKRVQNVLTRRPETGIHDDAAATARWHGGTRLLRQHKRKLALATPQDQAVHCAEHSRRAGAW